MKRLALVVLGVGVLYAVDLFMFRGVYSATAMRIAGEFFRRVF